MSDTDHIGSVKQTAKQFNRGRDSDPRDCPHGQLARSCELCEKDARIRELEQAIVEWCKAAEWGHPSWKSYGMNGMNKVLFDIAAEIKGRKET